MSAASVDLSAVAGAGAVSEGAATEGVTAAVAAAATECGMAGLLTSTLQLGWRLSRLCMKAIAITAPATWIVQLLSLIC